jgi:type IX secretion system PorP/SprF family membrane protein
VATAQDVHFSQFYESSILRNPALVGMFNGDYKVSANYRNQWSSISQPFITGQLSLETRIPVSEESSDFFGAGILAYYDKAGSIDMKTLSVYPSVSFNKNLGDQRNSFLSVGFTGGYLQRSFDPTKMTSNNQYQNGSFSSDNPTGENISNAKIQYWDVGAGVGFSSGGGENNEVTYFLGLSGYHFSRPKTSFYNNELVRLEMKWNANAGLTYKVNETIGVVLQGNYTVQGTYSELIGGGLLNWRKPTEREDDPLFVFYVGAFYRLNDALIPVVKMDYKRYSFGFSYDVNISKLKAASNLRGGYELSVVKTGLFSDPRWERSRTVCPHSFW